MPLRLIVRAVPLAALALGGCMTTPPDEDPVQIKLKDLDARVERIERVISNQSLLDLSNQLEALRSDVRGVHNDVDQMQHDLDSGRKQQRDLYADLDRRLKALESRTAGRSGGEGSGSGGASGASGASTAGAVPAGAGAAGAASAEGAGGDVPVPGGSDTANYQAAFGLLKDSQYDKAVVAFKQFLQAFPDSAYADNAQYWLGEAYYVNKSFPEALAAFQRVVDKYPQSRKVPDALLKVGFCDYELKQFQAAHEVLSQVVSTYPDTAAGNLARQRLDKMAAEKH
ncbi:MAG TPA: tol-pal system protein YbgF [Steroidobacteraceae bacterium]|nr:tol-pal system protein YbgF [Steroidobacteraceae bacterium]